MRASNTHHTSMLPAQVLALMMGLVSVLTLLIPEAAKLGGADGYPFYLVAVRSLPVTRILLP